MVLSRLPHLPWFSRYSQNQKAMKKWSHVRYCRARVQSETACLPFRRFTSNTYTYELRSTYCMIQRMIRCVIIIRVALVIRLPSVISYSCHNSCDQGKGRAVKSHRRFAPSVANHCSARERREMKSGEGRARANGSGEPVPHWSGTP